MNWLKKLSQVNSPDEIIQQVLQNKLGIEENGPAWQAMQMIGSAACDAINNAAGRLGLSGIDPSAHAKMRVLARAAGCNFEPQIPKEQQQPQAMPLPQLGEQEKPTNIPSSEIE